MPLGRIDEETVANIGTIQGGVTRNIVPDRVAIQAMARSRNHGKLEVQLAKMEAALQGAASRFGATAEVQIEQIYQAYHITPEQKPYREAVRAVESLGLKVYPRFGGWHRREPLQRGWDCVRASLMRHDGRTHPQRTRCHSGYGRRYAGATGTCYARSLRELNDRLGRA